MKKIVKPKNTFKLVCIVNEIIQQSKKKFEGIELNSLKFNPDFVLFICETVESRIKKADKKALVIDILTKILDLNDTEKKQIGIIIEHLHSSGLIKKVKSFFQFFKK